MDDELLEANIKDCVEHLYGDKGYYAAEALMDIGIPAVPALIEALKNEDIDVRIRATEVLGFICDPSAVSPLLEALTDKSKNPREIIITAISLGKMGNALAIPVLVETLNDENNKLRCRAIHALGEIGDISAVLPLLNTWNDKNREVREAVTEALGKLGNLPTLSRKIIVDTRFPAQQRAEVVVLLRRESIRHVPARIVIIPISQRQEKMASFGYVRRVCQSILKEENADARRGAQEVLDYLDGNILLRASQANSETEKDELLRGAQGDNSNIESDTLLRPFDAIATETNKPDSLWKRLFGKRDN